jgi:dihydroxy-acid dehydratase
VPVLSAVAPNGAHTIDQFEAAGGAHALLHRLAPLLDLGARTTTGRTLGDDIAAAAVRDDDVIRPLDQPCSHAASIVVLRGSLAPESAIARPGLRPAGQPVRLTGPALVFDSVPDALAALQRRELQRGQVLVLRGCGPVGGPAMAGSASRVVFAIYAEGLENDVAFVTDGQLSGLCNKGLTVAEVSPESGVGGPLALVENGDVIAVDIETARLDLAVSDEELAARRARLGPPSVAPASGYLSIYRRSVQPMSTGAVLIEGSGLKTQGPGRGGHEP